MTKQKPIHEIRMGSVRAAIWKNALEDGRVMYSVTFTRLFKDDGTWRDAGNFGRNQLPLIARTAEQALDWIYAQPGGGSEPPTED